MPRPIQTDLLKRVSRSFYLSMRLLPAPMREPVSLGYLLARASDTLADTSAAPVELRREALACFRSALDKPSGEMTEWFDRMTTKFVPHQTHEGERELLRRLPECWETFGRCGTEIQQALRDVLGEITAGQSWDLARFGDATPQRVEMVETGAELETYAYQVAGCVGEFWTRVGFVTLGSRFADPSSRSGMMESGKCLGQGLQLVNILRDLGADLGAGRCYLPKDELAAAGWREGDPGSLEKAIPMVAEVWRRRGREFLQPGWSYVAALRRGRVRTATALPLILAEKTIDALDSAGAGALVERVKVSRSQVWTSLARAMVS
ncbi:MAG: squalene/phytoene synthase family protein [Verrucomicrobiae bacterium]|nr:squalene/phytoene synthase family protein [Verrucomicrobiae bacterium]